MKMFDTKDAVEVVRGPGSVPPKYRLGLFGLASELPSGIPNPLKLEEEFRLNEIFRSRIHFVLFAWDNRQSKRFIDSQYRYYYVPNPKLVSQETLDLFNRHLTNLIKERVGAEYLPYLGFDFFKFDGKTVLRISCMKSGRPVFLKAEGREDFFIRVGASSISLSGNRLIDYVKNKIPSVTVG